MKTIMHIDMNAFFASVEQAANPLLRGKPVAVAGPNKRSVILTASYEARKFGVKTGMVAHEAKKACPKIIIVPCDNNKYTHASIKIVSIVKEYSPVIEVYSIDELFADMSGYKDGPLPCLAKKIKARIKNELNLTCSIGIAPNKLLAKLAGDMQKPDGLVIIEKSGVPRIMENLPIGDLCGIGRRMEKHLNDMGIKTCGELGRFSLSVLRKRFGIAGERLHLMGLGIDNSPVVPLEEAPQAKSVGHSMTLKKDITDADEIKKHIIHLSDTVGRRMRKNGLSGKTVTLIVRYSDFFTFGKQRTIKDHTNNSTTINAAALKTLEGIKLIKPVRLLGIIVSGLISSPPQIPLLEEDAKLERLSEAIDSINERYGDFALTRALLIERTHHNSVISPAWRPEGIHRIDF